MSLDISYYRKINNSYNSTGTVSKKESDIFTLKQHMANTFSDSLDFHDETLRNTVKQRFVISYYKDENKKKITAFPNEVLNIGDMIDCFDSKWLTTYVNPDKTVYIKGIIQQCNYTLPFQTTSSTIYNEPCIVLSQSEYVSGEKEGNVITLSDTQRILYVQYNEYTKYLIEGKRLFIDRKDMVVGEPKVYHISKVDRIVYMNDNNGLLKLTCDEDAKILDLDRKDLMIANYISSDPTPIPTPTASGVCLITDTKGNVFTTVVELKIGGSSKPFCPVFHDSSGNVITTPTPTWSITNLNGITLSDIDQTPNSTYPLRKYLKILNKSLLIGSSFVLSLVDSNNQLSPYSVNVKVVAFS